jgi:hypothetical protein
MSIKKSFVCSSANECEAVSAYGSQKECEAVCDKNVSYMCSPNLGCHIMKVAPNEKAGLYPTRQSCTEACSSPGPDYGAFSYGCSPYLGCHLVKEAPSESKGLYSNMEACAANCSVKPSPFSYSCSPYLGCHLVKEAPSESKGLYSNMQACDANCSAKPSPPRPEVLDLHCTAKLQ